MKQASRNSDSGIRFTGRQAHWTKRVAMALHLMIGLALVGAAATWSGCKRPHDPDEIEPAASAPRTLPPLVIKDDSENLMLTWVDAQGSAHMVYKAADVPFEGRDRVRVVASDREDGNGAMFYVANLTNKNPDGAYPITVMPRKEWDKMIEERRQARIAAAVASVAPPDPNGGAAVATDDGTEGTAPPGLLGGATAGAPAGPAPGGRGAGARGASAGAAGGAGGAAGGAGGVAGAAGGGAATPRGGKAATVRFTVIVYGASWCEACHQAMGYLQARRIPAIEKDIENDAAAAAEMQAKLAKSGMPRGSIPVIDVNGHILVGFESHQLDAAVLEASGGKAL